MLSNVVGQSTRTRAIFFTIVSAKRRRLCQAAGLDAALHTDRQGSHDKHLSPQVRVWIRLACYYFTENACEHAEAKAWPEVISCPT